MVVHGTSRITWSHATMSLPQPGKPIKKILLGNVIYSTNHKILRSTTEHVEPKLLQVDSIST